MLDYLTRLERSLDRCFGKDRFALRRRLQRLKATAATAPLPVQELEAIARRIEVSTALCAARAAAVPPLQYPEELPVSERRSEIAEAIRRNQVVIVCGETGSGKTTQLPKICLEAGRGIQGYIGHTQPRRIAARSVAARIADELKRPLGETVGYKVRFHDQTRPDSLIKLMTDGILLAETQADRFLDQYDTLIVDEAHERSLNIDFLLGYLKWLLPRRRDLKLVITSATIDPERFSRHFGDAPIVSVSGRTYPVEIRYRPPDLAEEESDETDRGEQQAILDAVDELCRENTGDILIFLSGEREIRDTAESLRKHHPVDCEVLPLYSRLAVSEQEKIFKPHGRRRIVLATNVAETSLTVPGIRGVIDAGYARISRYSHRSKLQRLPIEKISRASANQRAGRCGRVGPGICIRLYSEQDFLNRPEFTDPEILRTNLAAVILQMKVLNLGDIRGFPFVEPPDERLVRDGLKTLQELNALDAQGRPTELGRRLAKLPVDPRLGRILLAGAEENCLSEVCIIVAALSVPDPRERPADKAQAADQKHARFRHPDSDFMAILALWKDYEEQRQHLSGSKLRQYCRDNFLSALRMREWRDIHQQILEVIKGELGLRLNQVPADYGEIHRAILSGLLCHIGFRQDYNEYVGVRGQKFQIFPGSFLFKTRPVWIVSAEQVETSRVYARTVAKIEPEWIEKCGAHLLKRHHYEPHWERKAARGAVFERTALYGLTVQNGRKVPYENVDPAGARELFIRSALVRMDYDSKAPFLMANRKLLEEAEYSQQKERRADLVVDEETLYRFFDERVPAEVVNGASFEIWRKTAERREPRLLMLSREDITLDGGGAGNARDFPDELVLGPVRLKLEYRFEPGHEDDGVTAIVPLHVLNQIDPEPLRWLVPGLYREKVVALIKSLPKTWRIHFVPAPDFADRALPMLDYRRGSLPQELAKALKKIGKVAPPVSAFDEAALPAHLRINYALVDENNVVIARSRDLGQLQARHGAEAGRSFQNIACQEIAVSGRRVWDFDDLPAAYSGRVDGQELHGFPAIIDEGGTVGVRVFDRAEEAQLQHEFGLVRLLRLRLAREIKYLRKNLPVTATSELLYRQLPPGGRDLREDLLDKLMAALFLDDLPELRTRVAFDARSEQGRGDLVLKANELGRTVEQALGLYAECRKALAALGNHPAARDGADQLDHLVYAGFVAKVPYRRLKHYPRYFKALLHRLEKCRQDPVRDAALERELNSFWQPYWESVKHGQAPFVPERDEFRWALEEFRVSLFAQQMKTAYPVSTKRLWELWSQRSSPPALKT
ncbi:MULTISPECIES: ATP-dependent RNA helicase HrpA [Methylococcus]|uniref:ATP-dependent RNA helicase HrpA n=1 Tax=Methylococcus capsulatus TaxID=414 RepID=A0ABZ2F2S2_METCP|nr:MULTISPECIES: ATP-dependent RNA helicase HrpA [Methylococcus]MDF9391582.1 ATP-dependent RNA helicase HrpA [Methylococcus capsulatus]